VVSVPRGRANRPQFAPLLARPMFAKARHVSSRALAPATRWLVEGPPPRRGCGSASASGRLARLQARAREARSGCDAVDAPARVGAAEGGLAAGGTDLRQARSLPARVEDALGGQERACLRFLTSRRAPQSSQRPAPRLRACRARRRARGRHPALGSKAGSKAEQPARLANSAPRKTRPTRRVFSWARLGSNQRPPACEAGALPLSYAPSAA
jgi:hypothetical protein